MGYKNLLPLETFFFAAKMQKSDFSSYFELDLNE